MRFSRFSVKHKVSSHDPILVHLSFSVFVCMIENIGVHMIQFWCPIISLQTLKRHDSSCFETLIPTSMEPGPAVLAIFKKYFAGPSVGKLRIGNTQEVPEICQKLAFTHSIAV